MADQGLRYDVDLVLCIDCTGSMSPIIDAVKESTLRFHSDISTLMVEKNKNINNLRIKVIAFRDVFVDGPDWLRESKFFDLPSETSGYSKFVKDIDASGGGDEPESGLDALGLAIRSEWTASGDRRRHVIAVWTDASAHPLEKGAGSRPPQTAALPKDFNALTDAWEQSMAKSAKRLLVYAPDAYPWTEIGHHWNNAIHFVSKAGGGMADHEYKEILDSIARSI